MMRIFRDWFFGSLILIALWLLCGTAFGATWYVRADGGTRYDANVTTGQCNGLADAAYPGSGVNQPCAFKDYRYLWDDGSYGNDAWVIAGGDTVIIRGGPWRVGFNQGASANDVWCVGGSGNGACYNPTIPAGTPAQHTRILGENYANCSTGGVTDRSKLTQIFGGYGVYFTLNLSGAQYVDVECLEITSHATCMVHGSPVVPKSCSTNIPIDDYDSSGIATSTGTHDVLLQDLYIHGHTDRGIKGPIGGVVTAERVDIAANGMAGWDFDDGAGDPSVNGTWNFNDSIIEWNGCNQIYPSPNIDTCYGQSNGGYGDGVGTPGGMCLNVSINHSIFRYNTQDGLDVGHIDTGSCTLSITNSLAYGNSGGQFKWGYNFTSATVLNNLIVGNCLRLSAPIAGTASHYNANLGDFCRAGSTLSWNYRNGQTLLFANNTIVGYGPGLAVIGCSTVGGCNTVTWTVKNNLVMGYDNPGTYSLGGQAGGPSGFYCQDMTATPSPVQKDCATWMGTWVRTNNIWYGIRDITCPTGFTAELCSSPLFVGQPAGNAGTFTEAELDGFSFNLTSTSPAKGAGVTYTGIPATDYAGVATTSPPVIGALNYVSAAPPAIPVGGGTVNGRIATLVINCPSKPDICPDCFVFNPLTCSMKVVFK